MRRTTNCVWVWSLIAHVLIENDLVLIRSDKMSSSTVETVFRGYRMYKEVWDAAVGQVLPCQQECGSEVLVRSTLPFLLAKAGLIEDLFHLLVRGCNTTQRYNL